MARRLFRGHCRRTGAESGGVPMFVGLAVAGMHVWIAAPLAALAGFILRALAITRGLSLPAYGR